MMMLRLRLTFRRLLVLVALAAVVLALVVGLERRRAMFRRKAQQHFEKCFMIVGGTPGPDSPQADYHLKLEMKYSLAGPVLPTIAGRDRGGTPWSLEP